MDTFEYKAEIIIKDEISQTMAVQYTPDTSKPIFLGLLDDGMPTAPNHNRVMFQICININIPESSTNLEEYIKANAPLTQWILMIQRAKEKTEKTFANVEVGHSINVVDQTIYIENQTLDTDINVLKKQKMTALATNRYIAEETSSINYLGYNISTNRQNVYCLHNIYSLLKTNIISTINYKTTSSEFLILTIQNIEGLISAISYHIQMLFELEKNLIEVIQSSISKEQLDQININI